LKLIIRHSILLVLVAILLSASERGNYCDVFGTIFVTTSKNQTDYKVYVEDSEAFADILIYKEENELFADEPGKWFFVKDRTFADYTIYFTTNKREADFTVYYTESESFAGCN
jgi:hypothetical protein